MLLADKNRKEIDFGKYKTSKPTQLVDKGVLPNIEGLYNNSKNLIEGQIISHPLQDHHRSNENQILFFYESWWKQTC